MRRVVEDLVLVFHEPVEQLHGAHGRFDRVLAVGVFDETEPVVLQLLQGHVLKPLDLQGFQVQQEVAHAVPAFTDGLSGMADRFDMGHVVPDRFNQGFVGGISRPELDCADTSFFRGKAMRPPFFFSVFMLPGVFGTPPLQVLLFQSLHPDFRDRKGCGKVGESRRKGAGKAHASGRSS